MVMSKEATSNSNATGGGNAAEETATETQTDEKEIAAAATGDQTTGNEKPADKTFSQTDLDRAVAKAVKDAQKKVTDAEAKAKLSEDERAKAETEELRNQLRERDARDAVKDEAAKLGVKNPAAIYKIVKDELEYDDKGNVSNLADVIESAKADFPELFDTKPNQSIDAGAGTTGTGDVLTKEKLAKMTPAEINALPWEDVQKVLTAK